MATGMWTAVSGASAQQQAVDTVANNLANSQTMGFKKDQATFKEYLSSAERIPEQTQIPHGPITNRELYPLDGRDQSFVVVTGTTSDLRPGAVKVTHSPLDIALDGTGLIEVSTPSGSRYTRNGSLKISTEGRLVTNEGYPVLSGAPAPAPTTEELGRVPAGSSEDPKTAARYINLKDVAGPLSFTEEGEVYAGTDLIAKLSIAEFADTRKLRKMGAQYFENWDPTNLVAGGSAKTIVRQGMLETSNVNPIEEMTNLIKANRLYEHDMKAIKTYSDILQREANDIGKL